MRSHNFATSPNRKTATGVLIGFEHHATAASMARIRFATHRGEPIEFVSHCDAEQLIGDYVGVLYDPEQPGAAFLEPADNDAADEIESVLAI
jgi:hypothetical protein